MQDGYQQTVAGLLRKHHELLGDIHETQDALTSKQSHLAAIEAALRVFDPNVKLATEHQRRGAGVEGIHRFILDTIRREGRTTTLEAALAIVEDRGLDRTDKHLVTAMRKRAGDALQKMRNQGRVTGERYGKGGELEWRAAGR